MKKTIISFFVILIIGLFSGCAQPEFPKVKLEERTFDVPGWAYDAVWYQIFPERFANGDPTNDPPGVQPWGGVPAYNNFFGGDLQGVIDHLWYLEELGITAIYFNPIFTAQPNHKYHASDYMTIDPHFGTEETFRKLLAEAHQRGIRIIIDGVFNHTGPDFWAFEDIIKNGARSKYAHWYNIFEYPVKVADPPNYEAWWGLKDLPKLMVQHPDVKEYLFAVTKYWTDMGLDGWRLDVPNEMPHDFWREWRPVVRTSNPDAYIVGELWEDASPWLQGDQFDATMNYRFRNAVIDFMIDKSIPVTEFNTRLYDVLDDYAPQVTHVNQNLIGSHDTERYLTRAGGDVQTLKLTALLQMTHVGAPMIYYGDEIGMEGEDDPDCRRTMIWNDEEWDKDLLEHYKTLIKIRKENPALRRGSFQAKKVNDKREIYAFEREYDDNIVVVVLNNSSVWHDIKVTRLKDGIYTDALSGNEYDVDGGTVWLENMQPRWGLILVKK
jgi:cyclomaltodextrinase / maltogenic alpha-amylase / neopullulanase